MTGSEAVGSTWSLPEIVELAGDAEHRCVERFLYAEAQLMDRHGYEEWERLWADDGVYWIPAFHDDYDPDRRVSLVFDTRAGIAARVKRLAGSHAYAQQPRTRVIRTVSNVVVHRTTEEAVVAAATFVLVAQRQDVTDTWSGRSTYLLQPGGPPAEWIIARKKVQLVPLEIPLGNLSFLL